MSIFDSFIEVYIFGSTLNVDKKYPNDIDLLLVYQKYSETIQDEKNMISSFLEKLFKLHIDITILSEKELEETKFLKKLGSLYERLK